MGMRPGYKQTEVGVLPEQWELKPLSAILSKGRLGGNYPNQDRETQYPLIKMGNVARGYIDVSKKEYVTPGVTPDRQHKLAEGDVLFNTRNTLDLVGKVAIWRNELPVAFYNSNLMRLEFDAQQVCSNEYANAALNTARAVSVLRGLATGTTSVAAIYTRDLLGMLFIVPPLHEQGAIATALSDVDALLDALSRLIAKKRHLKQAAMQQLLTGQTRLPGFDGEWELTALGKCLVGRPDYGINAAAVPYSDSLPVYIRITDISGDGRFMPAKLVSVRSKLADNYYLSDGDIVFARTGASVGKSYRYRLSDGPLVFAGFLIRVRPNVKRLLPEFAAAYVTTERYWRWVELMSMRSGQPGINGNEYSQLPLLLPPLPEQAAIASVLSDMDAELEKLEQRLAKTRALKQGMMQELLTGRTRLVAPESSHA